MRILLPRVVEWMRDHRFPFSLSTEASLLNFIRKMDPQELLAGSRRILGTIYNPGECFERAITFLSHLGEAARAPIAFSDMVAVARSLWR